MASRADDWAGQAQRDLQLAEVALNAGLFEWACFAAQQAADRAVKAVAQSRGGEARGHSVSRLLVELFEEAPPGEALEAAQALDLLYIPTRYPNGWPEGKPADYFGRSAAEAAITDARTVLGFCAGHMARP